MFFIRAHSQIFPLIKSSIRYHWMMINSIIMFSDVQLKRQILTCFTALGKLSTVTLCLTDLPPLGRRRLQNSGEYRFLSVLYSLWLDWPKIMLLLSLFKAEASLNTSYLTDSYISFTLNMESVIKNTILCLKMMVKSYNRTGFVFLGRWYGELHKYFV